MSTTQLKLEQNANHRATPRREGELWPGARAPIDHQAVERAARGLRVALGEDPDDEGLRDTRRKGVGVVIEAEYQCMFLRGVRTLGARTATSALHGLVRYDPRTREESLSLTGGRVR